MTTILVLGYKGSGKDTVANYIQEHSSFQRQSLAEPLKAIAEDVLDMLKSQVDGPLKEVYDPDWGFSPREFLQWLGGDVFQYGMMKRFPMFKKIHGRTIWCRYLHMAHQRSKVVVSDGRYKHEVDYFRKHSEDCIVIRVKRGKDKSWFEKLFTHASEKDMDRVAPDYTIVNDGSLDELYEKVASVMKHCGVWNV